MKKYAEVENDKIVNTGAFEDDSGIPVGWIDVTDVSGINIGDPIIEGVATIRPSRWHSLENNVWAITPENQTAKNKTEAENIRVSEILVEQKSSGLKNLSVSKAFELIDSAKDLDDIKAILKKMAVNLLK